MTIPPPSMIFVLALGSIDTLLTLVAVLAVAVGIFAETPDEAAWIVAIFGAAAILGGIHVALNITSLVGLYLARRWAVLLGALAFSVSWPLFLLVGIWSSPDERMGVISALTAALFLACTLPHWQRMTWRFP